MSPVWEIVCNVGLSVLLIGAILLSFPFFTTEWIGRLYGRIGSRGQEKEKEMSTPENKPLRCECGEMALPSTGLCPKCSEAAGQSLQASLRTGDAVESVNVSFGKDGKAPVIQR